MTHGEYQAYLEKRAGKGSVGDLHKEHEWIRPITDRIEKDRIVDSRMRQPKNLDEMPDGVDP